MTAFIGRAIGFTWDGSFVAGVREKGIAYNGAPVDVTSDDDDGKRRLLTVSGQDDVDLTISGVTKDRVLRDAWNSGDRTAEVTLTYPDGSTLSGTFFLSTYTETGTYNDATTFDATLLSSGPTTYDPGTGA